jgi:hypothetical protein
MICDKCNVEKGTDFRKSRKVCRECDNAIQRERNKAAKNKVKPTHIVCKTCKKQTTDFRIDRAVCIECERSHGRQYRQDTDKAKEWAGNNRTQMAKLQREWQKNRRLTHEGFKIATQHRSILARFIRSTKTSRSKYVNCTSDRLKDWLQFQYSDGMTAENHAEEWQIDHVIPIERFLNGHEPEEVVINWANVRPVEVAYNGSKHKNIDKDQCTDHLKNICLYWRIRKLPEDTQYLEALRNYV